MKIKEFLKKYQKYIVIVLVVISLIGVLFLIFSKKDKAPEVVHPQNKSIVSPYVENLSLVNLTLPTKKDFYTDTTIPVYSILPYDDSIPALVYKFDSNIKEKNSSDFINSWMARNRTIVYYTSTGIFSVFTKEGIKSSLTINDKEGLLDFIKTYFGYTNISPESVLIKGNDYGGYTYKGKYLIGQNEFGSIDLDSYAFVIETMQGGQIRELSIFLYNPKSLTVYSEYSPMNEQQLINEKKSYIKRLSISESYEKLEKNIKGTLSLSSLDVKSMSKSYVFGNFSHGYVYPAYILSADARYTDFNKGNHAADVLLYFLAINPENVSKQEKVIEFFEYGTRNR